ncbi:hypothetical protein FB45DRAFT_1034317 [Roridomyces roridus]|uniref:Uncharacterized protein n=1 Tax=Roridomyces roridus TaxID=1738132 RepID=A0AAD7FDW2_9AGAR|nr:hypothetical protein FB45DRAFT_1034317 [Roridomyces roridus]
MTPRDPSPPLDLEPSVAEVGGLKRIELKYPHDDVKPLTPLEQVKLVLGFMPRLHRTPTPPASASRVSLVEYDSTEGSSAMNSMTPPSSRVRFSVNA